MNRMRGAARAPGQRPHHRRGQAAILIAAALIALVALVALAIDGANAYVQRRDAQNAVDAATMAGITTLATFFQQNRYFDSADQRMKTSPLTAAQNAAVLQAIRSTLAANNASVAQYDETTNPDGPFQTYYLDVNGRRYGTQQVGAAGSVAFAGGDGVSGSAGAQGLWVQSQVQASTFFARVIGWDTVQSDAHAGALLGGISAIQNMGTRTGSAVKLWPLTIFTDTLNTDPDGLTTLYDFNTRYASGNWGLLCFDNANCGNDAVANWLANGYDPSTGLYGYTENSGSPNTQGTQESLNMLPIGWDGVNDGQNGRPQSSGIWINAKTGNDISSDCSLLTTAANERWHVGIPITDRDNGAGGSNTVYHVVNVAVFEIESAVCPGSANKIQGKFLGYNWSQDSTTWNSDLSKAVTNGQVVIRVGP